MRGEAYRIRLYAPPSVDPTETTVLTDAATGTIACQVATVQGVAGYAPYLKPPTGRRGKLDPLTKRYDVGAWTFEVGDVRTGTGQSARWWSLFLGDVQGRPRILGCRVEVDRSTDIGVTFVRWATGRVQSQSLASILAFGISVGDLGADLKRDVFIGRPHASVSYARPMAYFPMGPSGPFGTIRAVAPLSGTVAVYGSTSWAITLDPAAIRWDLGNIAAKALADVADSGALGFGFPNYLLRFGNADTVRVRLYQGGTFTEWAPDFIDCRDGQRGVRYIKLIAFTQLPVGEQYRAIAPTIGAATMQVLTAPSVAPTANCPILLDDVNPVQLWADLLDGKFGRHSAAGVPLQVFPRDTTAFADAIATWGLRPMRFVIEGKEPLSKFMEEQICQELHLGWRLDAQGRVVPLDLRRRNSAAGLQTITINHLVAGSAPTWGQSSTSAFERLSVTTYHDRRIPFSDYIDAGASFADGSCAAIAGESKPIEILADRRSLDLSMSAQAIDARGFRLGVGEGEGMLLSHIRRLFSELTQLFGYGETPLGLTVQDVAATGQQPGDWALVNVDGVPNAATNARGGSRYMLCTERQDQGLAPALTFVDAGPNQQASAPVIVGVSELGPGQGLVMINLTLGADAGPVVVDLALTLTSIGAAPADTDARWRRGLDVRATGLYSIPPRFAQGRVWFRARGEALDITGVPKRPSAWVAGGFVDVTPAVGPSALTSTPNAIDNVARDFAFTNANTDIDIRVTRLKTGGTLELLPLLMRGTTRHSISGLLPLTQYTVTFELDQPDWLQQPAVGASIVFTTPAAVTPSYGTSAPDLAVIAMPRASTGDAIVVVSVVGVSLAVNATIPTRRIQLFRAPDASGAPNLGAIEQLQLLDPQIHYTIDFLPDDGVVRWYRAAHEGVLVYSPWVSSTPLQVDLDYLSRAVPGEPPWAGNMTENPNSATITWVATGADSVELSENQGAWSAQATIGSLGFGRLPTTTKDARFRIKLGARTRIEQFFITPLYDVNSLAKRGRAILTNPEFASGLAGVVVYDNNATGRVTLSVVTDAAAPNGSGKLLRVTCAAGAGVTAPGNGGFYRGVAVDAGEYTADTYHRGAVLIWHIRATIPVGWFLNSASNPYGTGGTTEYLTSMAGTGAIADYLVRQTVGVSGVLNTIGHWWLSKTTLGNAASDASAVTWDVAVHQGYDVQQPEVASVGIRAVTGRVMDLVSLDSGGGMFVKAAVATVNTLDGIPNGASYARPLGTALDVSGNVNLSASGVVGTVDRTKILDGEVITAKLGALSVTAGKQFGTGRGSALNDDPAMSDASAWTVLTGQAVTFPTITDGIAGNTSMKGAVGESNVASRFVVFDPLKVYRIRVRARSNGANGTFYLAVILRDSAGANIGGGSFWFYAAAGVTVPAGPAWTEYVGYFGAGTAQPFPANGRTMAAGAILNYTGSAGNHELQDLRIDEVIQAGLIAAVTITSRELAAGAVTANKLFIVPGVGSCMNSDPGCVDITAWDPLSGTLPAVVGDTLAVLGGSALESADVNGISAASQRMVLDSTKVYRASIWLKRMAAGHDRTAYGVVAFYDANGGLLDGATYPGTGWAGLGSYHYFLVSTVPPTTYTEYSVTFGAGQTVTPPPAARFMRVGALLTYGGTIGRNRMSAVKVQQVTPGELIVNGAITAAKISAGELKTSNYDETPITLIPTAGVKLDHTGTALKVAPNNLQVGTYTLTDAFFRALNALGGASSGAATDRAFYRGNNNPGTLGGAPAIARLTVTPQLWDTTLQAMRVDLKLHPTAASDNLDGMRYAKIECFRASALGDGSAPAVTLTSVGTVYCPLKDRLYQTPGTDSNTGNDVYVTCAAQFAGLTAGAGPAFKVTLYNAYGPSDAYVFYTPSGWTAGTSLTAAAAWPAGISGGGTVPAGGGAGGGGACVTEDTLILTPGGHLVRAGDLAPGCSVLTLHEHTLAVGVHAVLAVAVEEAECLDLHLTDGRILTASTNHRVCVDPRGAAPSPVESLPLRAVWMPLHDLRAGMCLVGDRPSFVRAIRPSGTHRVVKLSVDEAHTYVSAGLLSHNIKLL